MINLETIRTNNHLNQIDFCKIIGIAQGNYSRLLNDLNKGKVLNISIALNLYKHFGLSLDEIYGITKEEQEQGMGNHPTTLSEEEWEWLELGSEVLRVKGTDYYQSLKIMIKAVINNP